MKIRTTALAVVAMAAGATAHAQSAVTLYGVVDANVQVASGASTLSRMQSGGINGSRLGVRATEDLGDGLRALVVLEHGFAADTGITGQGGAMWGRQAFVGLESPYGRVSLGRQYSSIYALTSELSAFSNVEFGPSTTVIGGFGGYEPVRGSGSSAAFAGGPARVNNSIKYESPSFAGLRVGALWGFGENAAGVSETRISDLYARYTSGPIDLMLSYVDDKNAAALDVRTLSLGGAYSFGAARLLGGIISVDDNTVGNNDGKGHWIGADYRTGKHLMRAQYVVNNPRGADNNTRSFGVGYQYDLSRRTAVYSSLTRFRNAGTAMRWSGAMPAGLSTSTDNNITEVVAGIRHSF